MSHRPKITIVGAGNVGASCAAWIAERDLGNIVLLDIPAAKDMPKRQGPGLAASRPPFRTTYTPVARYHRLCGHRQFRYLRHYRRHAPQNPA